MSMAAIKIPGVLPPDQVAKLAKKDLNEDPSRRDRDVKAIQEWLKKQPHLDGNVRSDETLILHFLRGCKFSLEKTKEKLDMFYSVKAACPEFFDNWDTNDARLRELVKSGTYVVLRGFDKKGRKVNLMKGGALDPSKHTLLDQFRVGLIIMELGFADLDQSSVTGFVGIQDMSGMTFQHAALFSPAMGKKAMTIWQDAYPSRPQAMHFLNMPSLMEGIFAMMRNFAKEKMRKRLQVHEKKDNYKKLQAEVGKDVLPAEYGGTNGTLQDHIDYTLGCLDANSQFIRAQSGFKADEAKRPGKARTYSDIFGMEGSFRQLTVD